MNVKRITSVLMSLCLLATLFAGVGVAGKAEAAASDLPFKLAAPSNVSVSWLEGGDSLTTMNLAWSMADDQATYMSKANDDEDYKKTTLNALGYDNLFVNIDVDWAIDDKVNGWHHTKYWDYPYINQFTNGSDENGNTTLGPWDVVEDWNDIGAKTTNEMWILRGISPTDDNTDWVGDGHNPGLKNQLKSDQYEIKKVDGEPTLTIDFSKHTVYVRVRWCFVTDKEDTRTAIFSDWSETAAYGKDTAGFKPYTPETMPIPQISNLALAEELSNDYPVVTYDLAVPDELTAKITEIKARGGDFRIYIYAKPYGVTDWTELQDADFEIKPGNLTASLQHLIVDGQPAKKDTPIEFRARYYANQKTSVSDTGTDIYSEWSNVLKLNADLIPKPTEIGTDTDETGAYRYLTEVIGSDKDIKNSTFGTLQARQNSVSTKSLSLKWNKVSGATKYAVYGNKCGKNPVTGNFNTYQKLSEVTNTSVSYTQVNGQDVLSGNYYKFIVVAVGSDNKILKASKTIHIATTGGTYTNPKTVTVAKKANKGKLALKKGKSFALKAKYTKADKKKKVNDHRKIQYESSNTKVATVSSSGKIKAKKKGKAVIYAYAQNGIFKKITFNVK